MSEQDGQRGLAGRFEFTFTPKHGSWLNLVEGEQINSRQQTERAMAFVFMITREGRVDARHGRQIRRRRGDGLDSRLFVVGDVP
jgi:hypothetical protein